MNTCDNVDGGSICARDRSKHSGADPKPDLAQQDGRQDGDRHWLLCRTHPRLPPARQPTAGFILANATIGSGATPSSSAPPSERQERRELQRPRAGRPMLSRGTTPISRAVWATRSK